MQKWAFVWLIVCCLIGTYSNAFVANVYEINDQCQVKLDELSKAKTASNLELPQMGWEPVKKLPDRWGLTWPNYSGGAWYRLKWGWQCNDNARLAEPIALSLNYINSAGAVFLNGDLLWRDQHLTEPLSKSWNMSRYWVLPISGLKQDNNEILIYVYGYAAQSAGIGKLEFSDVKTADIHNQKRLWNSRTLFQINIILSGCLGIICLSIWLFRRSESSFGWFALSTFFWILFVANTLSTETYPFSSSLVAARANISFFALYILSLCTYILRFIHVKKPKTECAMLIIAFVLILSLWTVPLNLMSKVSSSVFLFYCGTLLVVYVYLCIVSVKTKRLDFIFLAVCMSIILMFSVFDIYLLFTNTGHEVAPLSPYSSPIIMLFIVILLASRLNKNFQKIEKFNEELSTKVQQVSLDLSSSLNDKHRLALTNARLQERIKLSHDLHDGLGSSIVRSMILVDQCAINIPNQQFLSMLKLLRDDLRQIIDSGSETDNKIPETPIIWLAPIRHRFSQLMDEMDIQATWNLAKQWEAEPTALQCLNLSRVLEESLTNIIKHSQATQVRVTLGFIDQHKLELQIEDNGLGFNVACMTQNGMSIGMRSMKTRVERMGGQLQITSTKGETIVQAIIYLKLKKL